MRSEPTRGLPALTGSGFSSVIIDTGIDLNHPFFGPDADSNGIDDRIVFQYDFSGANDSNASDVEGHGSNVASIVASQDATYTGMAPATGIIALKVFTDAGNGSFGDVEEALQWVVANAATYNIASVNMSLGDTSNHNSPTSLYGLGDELAALNAMNVMVVSAAGNDYFTFQSQGVSYPAADPNSLAISAVWDGNNGGPILWSDGARGQHDGRRSDHEFFAAQHDDDQYLRARRIHHGRQSKRRDRILCGNEPGIATYSRHRHVSSAIGDAGLGSTPIHGGVRVVVGIDGSDDFRRR